MRTDRLQWMVFIVWLTVGMAVHGAVSAQEAGAAPAQDAAPPAESSPPPPPAEDDLPSLDELLGIEDGAEEGSGSEDPAVADLTRKLSGAEVGDAFKQAVTLMGDAAGRIGGQRDTGIATQRLQEDIIKRLDQLIASLQQMQSGSSGSSSSSSGSEGRQQPANQARRGPREEAGSGENRGEAALPGRRDGALRPELESARAAWGALPERVRDMLMQGSSDPFSALYGPLTEAYYRKLAEEGRER